MKSIYLAVAITCAILGNQAYAQSTGLILEDRAIYEELPDMAVSSGILPANVDMSDSFPRPGSQGKQGSCAAWACAYALKTHQEEVERRWGVDSVNHIFSPAFIYNQINGGEDKGSRLSEALSLMQREGVALWRDFPYTDQNYTNQPSSALKSNSFRYRISSFRALKNLNEPRTLKSPLAEGHPVIISINTDNAFHAYRGGIFNSPMGETAEKHGRHAMCMIGYNDTSSTFLLMNSWGTDWGESGLMRIHYSTLAERINSAYVAIDRQGDEEINVDPNSPWLYPNSDSTRLSPVELSAQSVETLWRARNEIFARRGYIFNSPRGKEFASALGSHYDGRFDHDQTEARFNEFEHYNIAQIIAIEWGRGDRIGNLPPNTWVFCDSNVRRLTKGEVSSKSKEVLWKARNEIFARRGFIFQSSKGKDLARSLGHLYSPVSNDMDRIYESFNAIEKYNVDLIMVFENGGKMQNTPSQPTPIAKAGEVWMFPQSSARYLTTSEVSALSASELWRARNEIYARRGHQFQSDRGKALVESLGSAYSPQSGDATSRMNQYEKANISLIKKYE